MDGSFTKRLKRREACDCVVYALGFKLWNKLWCTMIVLEEDTFARVGGWRSGGGVWIMIIGLFGGEDV